jgi:hypothetical protein
LLFEASPGKVCGTISGGKISQERAGGVAQGVGPEFKPQYRQKKKKKENKQNKTKPHNILKRCL